MRQLVNMRVKTLSLGLAAIVVMTVPPAANAAERRAGQTAFDSYPERPVRLIDPYAPGGGSGLIARMLSAKLPEWWGKQVVVDNRPGAAAAIGTELCARAAPDGYTLCMGKSG